MTLNLELNLFYGYSALAFKSHSVSKALAADMAPYILAPMNDGLEEVLAQSEEGNKSNFFRKE